MAGGGPKKWIASAIKPSHKGEFKAKAEAAGETTRQFAKAHEHDSGKTGQQSRLAETLMGMHKARRTALYTHKRT